jgi:hypothetical protein
MFPPGQKSFLFCDSTYLIGGKIMIFIPPVFIFMSIIYAILLSVVVFVGENIQNGRGGGGGETV